MIIYIHTQLYMDSSGQWQKNLRAVGQGTIPSSPSHVTMLRTTWRGWNPSRKGHFQIGDFTYSWFTTILQPYDWDDDVQLIFSRRSWSHQPSCDRNMSRVAVENLGRTRLRSFEDLRRQPTLLGTKPAKLDADMKPKALGGHTPSLTESVAPTTFESNKFATKAHKRCEEFDKCWYELRSAFGCRLHRFRSRGSRAGVRTCGQVHSARAQCFDFKAHAPGLRGPWGWVETYTYPLVI